MDTLLSIVDMLLTDKMLFSYNITAESLCRSNITRRINSSLS